MEIDYDDAVASLRRTPQVLRSYFGGLTPAWLDGDEGPGTWTPVEALAHMVHVEPTWTERLDFIAQHGDSEPFPLVDRGGHMEAFGGLDVDQLLARFGDLRADGLARGERTAAPRLQPGRRGKEYRRLHGLRASCWGGLPGPTEAA